ncbi:MAG TPA: NUDIX hydrolase, partial [Pyrinomonadaceae bacterium]|nr:NUDIX hydrolase [Pyrinomonadaceae bacterium]
KEFRYAVGRETFEVVGGAIDEGEEPQAAARRELHEELGIEASELVALGHVDPMTSLIDSPSHLFLARRLRFVEQQQEGSERIERIKVSLARAVQMVYDSEITHGASGVLIMRAQKFLQDESAAGGGV